MELDSVGIVIATRELDLADVKKVTVTIGRPETFSDGINFYCPYQITGIGNKRVRYAGGIDAAQALQLALKMIGADLYTSREAKARALTWEGGENGDLGFPLPDTLSDLRPS